jgi:DNA-binding IclR family transcriptional regulator
VAAHTIVTPEAVRDECEATLDRGFASEDGEHHDELHSIAVPVPDRSGDVMIAIGITDTRRKNVAKHLTIIEAAARRLRDSCDY